MFLGLIIGFLLGHFLGDKITVEIMDLYSTIKKKIKG